MNQIPAVRNSCLNPFRIKNSSSRMSQLRWTLEFPKGIEIRVSSELRPTRYSARRKTEVPLSFEEGITLVARRMDEIPEETSRFWWNRSLKRAKTSTQLTPGRYGGAPFRFRLKGPGGSASVNAQDWSLLLLEQTGADFLFASNSYELNWSIKEPEYLCTP